MQSLSDLLAVKPYDQIPANMMTVTKSCLHGCRLSLVNLYSRTKYTVNYYYIIYSTVCFCDSVHGQNAPVAHKEGREMLFAFPTHKNAFQH